MKEISKTLNSHLHSLKQYFENLVFKNKIYIDFYSWEKREVFKGKEWHQGVVPKLLTLSS